jgi:protein O-mannosyl-transferase
VRERPTHTTRAFWPTVWPLLALLLIGFLLLWNTLDSFLVSDDFGLIASVAGHGPFGMWSTPGGYFRPLTSVSLWLDYRMFGLSAPGYHVTNILLHCLSAFALFLAVRRLLADSGLLDRARYAPHATALVFLVLSTHSEAVAWVSDRNDLLACLLALLSFYAYLRFAVRRSVPWLLLSGGLFLAAVLSKESVVAFPLVIVLYEACRMTLGPIHRRRLLPPLLAILFFAAMAALYLALRLQVTHGLNGGWTRSIYADIRIRTLVTSLLRYPLRSVVLIPDVSKRVFDILSVATYGLCAVALFFVIRRLRQGALQRPAVWVVGLVGLAAVSQLLPMLPLSVSLGGSDGERFLYWPSALFCAFAVLLLSLAIRNQRWVLVLCAAFAIGSAVTLFRMDEGWRAAGALCRAIIASGVEQCPAESLLVVNLPDKVQGAYVFRNGFQPALTIWGKCQVKGVYVVSHNTMAHPSDAVHVTKIDAGYKIELTAPNTQFVWYGTPPPTSGSIVVSQVEETSFVFKVAPLGPNTRVLYYSEGALHRLEP